jgi:hypothetical protein
MRFSRFSKYKARLLECKRCLLMTLAALFFLVPVVRAYYGLGKEMPKGEIILQQPSLNYISEVIPRAQEIWIARDLGYGPDVRQNPIPKTATILNTLMDKTAEKKCPWVISRLEQGKPMRNLACFSGRDSLLVSPDSKTLVLLTDADVPNRQPKQQTAVFRSDDQGETWRWLKEGFFPEASWMADAMEFHMHGTRELWTWKDLEVWDDDKTDFNPATWSNRKKAENLYTELYYSPDFGVNVETIPIPKTLFYRFDEKKVRRRTTPYVVQLAPDRAMILLSQRVSPIEDWGNILSLTTQIELRRVNNRWQMQAPRHLERRFITGLQRTGKRVVATMTLNDDDEDKAIVEFDPEQQNWKRVGEPPNPFFPLSSTQSVLTFQAGENALLLDAVIEHEVRWLYPPAWFNAKRAKTITAFPLPFYSVDQGRSWQQLAIKPLAFQPEEGRIFWYQDNKLLSAILGQDN